MTYSGNNIVSTGVAAVATAGACTGSNFDESNYVQASGGAGSMAINNSASGMNVRQMVAASPATSTGTAQLGDTAYSNTGTGGTFAWWCTTAGTPGVWTGLTIPMNHQKLADGNVIVSWVLWIVANLAQINMVLQCIALILAIIASSCAIRYHLKRDR